MKRIMKIMPILIVLVLAFSIIGTAGASTADGTVLTNAQLYIGDYEVDTHSGEAHIIFGQVSDASVEFGVIITDSANNSFLFKGNSARISENGRYGIAIYDLPEGDYIAQAYSGAADNRILGAEVPFTKGVDSYTVVFDVNGGEGTIANQTVAQGGNATKPTSPTPADEDLPFLGWTDADGVPFDFTAPVFENKTVYAQYEEAGEVVEPVYNVEYLSNGGGGYFGNSAGADLSGGKSLVMEWDMLSSNFTASNYSIGFFILDSTAVASKNNYPYTVGQSAVWWTNHAYFDYRHLWDGAQDKDTVEAAGAVFHENLFHSYDIFKSGRHYKIVYTSYTSSTGASIEIYTKDIGADDSTYTFWTSVTNIPSTAVPAESDVHLHFAVSGGVYNITNFKPQITNLRYYVESDSTKTDVSSTVGIATGNNVTLTNIYDTVYPTAPGADTTTDNLGLAVVGNKTANGEGSATWVFNNYFTADDSLSFEVANGASFEIYLDYKLSVNSGSEILLKEEDVNYRYYKVYFDGSYVTLAGRNAEDAVWETVVKRGYQMDLFYIGLRASSSVSKANVVYFDNVTYVNDGTTYAYTFNDGETPDGFTVLATTSASCAYVPYDVFTVKYALYDGSVVETQEVGYGMNATLPAGTWVNATEAQEKATFIDSDTMIMLVREGDNIGGNYVAVTGGTISNYGPWDDNFAVFEKGTNATVVAGTHADGYSFKGWQVGDEIISTSSTYTFAVNANTTLIAKFNVPTHVVTVVNGTIDGITATTAEIEDKTSITVIANTTAGKVFQGWSNGTEIVSNSKNYTFTVTADVTLTATYIDAYTVNVDMSEVGGTDTKYIVESENQTIAMPDSSDIDTAPTNAELGFVTDDGKVWDFDTDVITRDITIYGKWVAVAELYDNAWKMTGCASSAANSALGNSAGVDLSDGSTLTMEFDVFDATIAQANYNFYFWIRPNTDYGAWSNYCFAYANWAYGTPWAYHGNLATDGVSTTSNNWSPDLIIAANQSTRISYTAPTVDKNGSLIIYTKHIAATEWNELCYVKDIPLSNVTDTSNVFMGLEMENANCNWSFINFRMYVNDYEYNVPAMGINGYLAETENTYVKPVTWGSGKEYNVRVDTDAGEAEAGSFQMWFGNGVGINLDEGESLTWEFTVDSVEYGLWYNVWGGIMINSGAFPSSCPWGSYTSGIGWYSNFALNTGDYSGRTAALFGTEKGSAAFATGYNLFDPYTDVTGTYSNGIAPIMIKVVYTSYDKTNNVPGSIVYYKRLKTEGTWTKVTEVTGITAELYDSMHITLWYNSSQNAGGSFDFEISNFSYYTSNSKSVVPVISAGGQGVVSSTLPTYTVKFMNGTETYTTQEVEEGSLATAASVASFTPALGGKYIWADEDGNEFDFETSIEADTTLYLKQIGDPAVKANKYQLTAPSQSWTHTLGTSVAVDLSDGSTATVEFDVIEGLTSGKNLDAGFYLWQSLPTYGSENGYFGGFYDNMFYGNDAYTTSSANYGGLWKTEDFSTTGYSFGEKFRPGEIFATGKTVKMVYTAPTASTEGSMIVYTKTTGEDDSTYAEQASIRGLTTAMVCNTANTYLGFFFRQSANLGDNLDMTVQNWHIYTDDGDIPAMFDHNRMAVENLSVTETLPEDAYIGEDTIGNTYEIGYVEGTTAASGWFGNTSAINLTGDEVLTMEFEVLAAGNKWQNANSGFTICDIDPTTETSTSPQNYYNLDGVNSFTMYGNWAFDTATYENRTAKLLGASGATVSGIWDPYTDVAAGDWVKVEYKPYTSADSTGYLRVYTKVGANGTYVLNASVEGITQEIRDNVRLVWFVSSSNSGLNFTHTITNYRMFTSKGTALTDTDCYGGNHAVTVTEA